MQKADYDVAPTQLLVVKKQSNVEHMRPWRGEPEEKGTPTASGQQFSTPEA